MLVLALALMAQPVTVPPGEEPVAPYAVSDRNAGAAPSRPEDAPTASLIFFLLWVGWGYWMNRARTVKADCLPGSVSAATLATDSGPSRAPRSA